MKLKTWHCVQMNRTDSSSYVVIFRFHRGFGEKILHLAVVLLYFIVSGQFCGF